MRTPHAGRPSTILVSALALVLLLPAAARAQAVPPQAPAPGGGLDPDVRLDPLEPDFNLAALPTTLRMPEGKWAFRVTHRFTRNLGQGDFGDALANLFGLDGGSQVGLEVRYGLRPGTQVGIHRTSDRAIQLFAQQSILSERQGDAFGLDGIATLEGDDNLSEHFQSALGVALSRKVAERAAVYAQPLVVLNANPFDAGDAHTLLLGLGARVRVRPSMYLTGEYTPRLAGYNPDVDQISFGFESRAGGHLFQLNVSNGFGTTFGQLARGGVEYDQWFLGFNISRKFFR